MNVRKHWKKIIVALFAPLWSGCADKPAIEKDTPVQDNPVTQSFNTSSSSAADVAASGNSSAVESSESVARDREQEYDMPVAIYGPPCMFDGTCNQVERPVFDGSSQEKSEGEPVRE